MFDDSSVIPDQKNKYQNRSFVQTVEIASFVGRTHEIAEILSQIIDPACRLLTLVGPGGIGKTRLATEAAAFLAQKYHYAVYFVSLQPLTSSDKVIGAVAEALNFRFETWEEPKEQLLNFLATFDAVLLLDNFEHLSQAGELVKEIAARAPGIQQIITAREQLNLDIEHVLHVGGLAYPSDEQDHALESYSAVELFVETANRLYPGFVLQNEAADVVRICALLEGMPLAIELAASWIRTLSCHDILTELQRGLDILETFTLAVPERHRSMRAVLNTSWEKLTEAEQAIFRRLSVFRGGFTLDALQSITGATPHLLYVLVDCSWVRRDARGGRYKIHELLRQYAEDQLRQFADDSVQVRDLHCQYYLNFLERVEAELQDKNQKDALQWIEADLQNIHLALHWVANHSHDVRFSKSLYSIWFFYDTGSRFHECEQLFGKLVTIVRMNTNELDNNLFLGRILTIYGSMSDNLDRHNQAMMMLERALAILRNMDARQDIAFCLYRMGASLRFWEGRIQEAQACFQASLDLYDELGNQSGIVTTLGWLGVTFMAQGDLTAAERATLAAITLARERETPWDQANAAVFRGEILKKIGEFAEARRLFQEAHLLYTELDIHWGVIKAIREIAQLSLMLGDVSEARRCLLLAFTVATQLHLKGHNLYTLIDYGKLMMLQGVNIQAVEIFALLERQFARLNQERETLHDHLDALQAKLSPSQFAKAIEDGRSLNLESTIDAAIADLSQTAPSAVLNPLTSRELEIVQLIAEGLSNRAIAEQLVLTPGTIKWYVSEIFSKLGVSSRTQLLAQARQLNLLS